MSVEAMNVGPRRHLVDAPAAGLRLHRLGPVHQDGPRASRRRLNIYTARLAPIGATLRKIDFEKSEKLGINSPGRLHLEGPARFRRLHRVRPLHGGLPGQSRGQGAVAARHHSRPAAADRTSRSATLPQSYHRRHAGPVGRSDVGVHDLRRLRRGLPGVDRADAQDRRHAAVPGDGRRRVSRHDAAGAHVAGDARPSVSRHGVFARRLGPGPADRHDGRSQGGRRAVVGRLRRGAGRAQSESRPRRWPNC